MVGSSDIVSLVDGLGILEVSINRAGLFVDVKNGMIRVGIGRRIDRACRWIQAGSSTESVTVENVDWDSERDFVPYSCTIGVWSD